MRTALINPPSRGELHFTKPSFPLGIGYIKAMCELRNISCDIYDFSYTTLTDDELCSKYNLDDYDLIGFSTFSVNFRDTMMLAKKVKNNKNAIVLGGHHATLLGEKILADFDFVDYILMGYSENSFIDLVRFHQGKHVLRDISGLCYRNESMLLRNEIKYDEFDIENLPIPNRDNIIYDYPSDYMDVNVLSISASRGCVYSCSFCVNCRNPHWLSRNVSSVVDEVIQQCDEYRYNCIQFVDCNFFIDCTWAVDIIREINYSYPGIKIELHARSDQVVKHETEIEYLLRNFNVQIFMGIESNSTKALQRYGKETSPEINQRAINILKKYYPNITVYLILFDSLTTLEELRETFDFLKRNHLFSYVNARSLRQEMIVLYGTDYFDKYSEYYSVDIHSRSTPIYVNTRVQILMECYSLFFHNYDDRIREKLAHIIKSKNEVDDGDYKFFNVIYFYVFEFFLNMVELFSDCDYSLFCTTGLGKKLEEMLAKYE